MSNEKQFHLLFVEDQKMISAGLAQFFPAHYRVDFAYNMNDMRDKLATHRFDLALLDMQMEDGIPGLTYLDTLQRYKVPALIVATSITEVELLHCYENGVMGYVPKKLDHEKLTSAIEAALLGQMVWPTELKIKLGKWQRTTKKVPKRYSRIIWHLLSPDLEPHSDDLIAQQEHLSVRTVSHYVSGLLQFYKVKNRTALTQKLRQMGYTQEHLPT